ncbi:uncharacterized protein LOC119726983 isoform X1 [Patiria miniata]|uniref:Uncharacterized protein n=1 Tax=Patiria miniata TaxID=46514 RepID=A0A913ZTH6_PATMI|nr:uncharacterized protein LOC119726967 isoform X1 [Patiria miniata]XP_038054748.1 uncharacterized protein LOC119726970 isoform X1 [Patiria miniata]XP_038054749.1 uncharacterized protein LOC119726970 isoform X1 [Patiria miniata]XP_038054764.1 uncharacterized protein LOC119726983 isoform X1 [Patiria miniata]XP_038054765.1 uncharacterized protein LOC119726983 isoform X1 [Patiria miniata]
MRPICSGFKPESVQSESYNQPTLGGCSHKLIFSEDQSRLQLEVTNIHQPVNGHPHSQKLMSFSQKCMSSGQIGQTCHDVKARCTDSGSHRMSNFHVALQPHAAEHDELTASGCSMLLPGASQGLLTRHHARSHDMNSGRKSRDSEGDSGGNVKSRKRLHGKRSQQFVEEESCYLPSRKQFLSEEKMAARMSNLSITNENKMASLQERWLQAKIHTKRQLEEIESRLSDSESDVESECDIGTTGDDTSKDHCRIHVSAELKTALRQQEAFLPDSVVKSMSNICHQIVLWKPPSSFISDVINPSASQDLISKDRSDGQSNDTINPSAGQVHGLNDTANKHTADTSHDKTDWKNDSSSTDATQLFDLVDDDDDMEL